MLEGLTSWVELRIWVIPVSLTLSSFPSFPSSTKFHTVTFTEVHLSSKSPLVWSHLRVEPKGKNTEHSSVTLPILDEPVLNTQECGEERSGLKKGWNRYNKQTGNLDGSQSWGWANFKPTCFQKHKAYICASRPEQNAGHHSTWKLKQVTSVL